MIPGFYDRVRPLSLGERELLAAFPLSEADWLAQTGAPALWGEPEYTLVERIGARPTLDVTGMWQSNQHNERAQLLVVWNPCL